MAKNTDHLARSFETENTGGVLTGFLAEEDELDRGSLWRLGSWGAASVGAVIVALLASQSSIGSRRDQVAAADLLRQSGCDLAGSIILSKPGRSAPEGTAGKQ